MSVTLTAGTCARLNAPGDCAVLVSTPVLRVVDVSEANMQLCDFVVERVATVSDGDTTIQVALPRGLRVWAAGTGPQPTTVSRNDVIKVQRMLRLPDVGDDRVILIHDVEIYTDEDVPLEITHYEEKIQRLQAELATLKAKLTKADATLKQMGQDPTFFHAILALVNNINELVDQAMAE